MNKKGFTLIELLAVIVILAIIALIATPIVLSIINDSKESSQLRSAEMYKKGLETSIATAILDEKNIVDKEYSIVKGNVCLDTVEGTGENRTCKGEVLEVQMNGEVPESGIVTIESGKITNIELTYSNGKTIVKNIEGKLVYFNSEYEIGQEITFNPGDGEKTWYVINEDSETVSLILSENLGNPVEWYKYSNYNTEDTSNYGPKDALDYLNSLTTKWDNVDPIKKYAYTNNSSESLAPNGYQKIVIQNGVTKLTHKDGTIITDVAGVSKARILSLNEVLEVAQKANPNLKEENLRTFISDNLGTMNTLLQSQGMPVNLTTVDEAIAFSVQLPGYSWLQSLPKYLQTYNVVLGMITQYKIGSLETILLPEYLYGNLDKEHLAPAGYWTLSSLESSSFSAWRVDYDGYIYNTTADYGVIYGVRPVITIPKSKLVD